MKKVFDAFLELAYVGHLPYVPGTFASLICCLFLSLLPERNLIFDIVFLFVLILVSLLFIRYSKPKEKDPRYIVIDEFIGMYATMVGHRINLLHILAGFILFRFFDIMKPYPVRKLEDLPGGLGIIADDVAAAFYANLSLYLIRMLPWNIL